MFLGEWRQFWRATFPATRAALAVGGSSALINLLTYFGLDATGPGAVLYVFHLVVMLFGASLFFLIVHHHYLTIKNGSAGPLREGRIPRTLVVVTLGTLVYGLVTFFWVLRHGEGSPELQADGSWAWVKGGQVTRPLANAEAQAFEDEMLRVFSAWWLFFSMIIGLVWHVVRHRINRLGGADPGEAAA